MCRQVLGDCLDRGIGALRSRTADARHAYPCCQRPREPIDLARLEPYAVIRLAAGHRRHPLHHVQAVQRLAGTLDPAPRRELTRGAKVGGPVGGQEVGVERDDDVRLGEVVLRLDHLAKGEAGAGASVIARQRLPLDPLRLGIGRQHLPKLRRHRRRAHRLGEDAQARALRRRLPLQRGLHRRDERRPGSNLAELDDRLRAIGIVEGQHRRLGEQVGGAEAPGMIRVPFHLRRPSLVTLDEDTGGDAAQGHRAREKQRLAGNLLLGLSDVGDDQLGRLHRAGADPGQRHRGAHQLEERATADRIVPLRGIRRELAVQELLEFGGFRHRLQAAPVLRSAGLL